MLTITPIPQNQRIPIIDILRGWALIGVVLVNYYLFFYLDPNVRMAKNDIPSHLVRLITDLFFTNKSRMMLNILFGYGFSVLITNLQSKNINPIPFFARRMFWLLIIGLINTCLYYGDFLKDYALVGIFMLFFYKAPAKASLYIGLLLLVIFPLSANYFYNPNNSKSITDLGLYASHNVINVFYYGLKDGTKDYLEIGKLLGADLFVLACFLLGQYFQKTDVFNSLKERKLYLKSAFWFGIIITVLIAATPKLSEYFKIDLINHYNTQFIRELSHMFVIMSTICWLYFAGKLKRFFNSLQIVGRMTLTNYMMQNLIGLLLFSGFGFSLAHKMSFYFYIIIALTVFISQVYLSRWWLSKFKYGPIEWIWRMLSYGKKLPLRIEVLT